MHLNNLSVLSNNSYNSFRYSLFLFYFIAGNSGNKDIQRDIRTSSSDKPVVFTRFFSYHPY